MPDMNPAVIHCEMYEGDEQYVGIAQVTLPSLQFMTQEVAGAGIMGRITVPLIAQVNAMQIQIQMLTLSRQGVQLAKHELHTWEFRELQQRVDTVTKAHSVESVKHVIKAFPTGMDGGTVQPHSTSSPNITAAVHYWATYRNGVKELEIDPGNYICYMDGRDYGEEIRTALGR